MKPARKQKVDPAVKAWLSLASSAREAALSELARGSVRHGRDACTLREMGDAATADEHSAAGRACREAYRILKRLSHPIRRGGRKP